MEESLQSLDQYTTVAIDAALRFAPKVMVAILILVAGWFAGRWTSRAMLRSVARVQLEPPVRALLGRAAHLLVLGLFAIMALQNLGVELLPLIAGLGIAGAGIALALQGVLGNIVAGLTIMVSRPFRVGDYISIVKEEGVVHDITLFNTTLLHSDLSRVVIPNRKIVGEILHNYGGIRQLGFEVTLSYQADAVAAITAIQEVLRANPRVLKDPVPGVGIARLAESGVVIGAGPWVQTADGSSAVGEINRAILEALRARSIALPVPQREIRVVSTTAYVAERTGSRDAA